MHVIATSGHVDHGKSTLVAALTGTEPDRLAEEHRRGLSIELGYCWADFPGAGEVAFVDVPGHERFISTMLSGIGPVPAVLFVVAADDPWMPQSAEHLAALDALGVEHGVVAVTRSDLADPGPATERARAELGRTSLRGAPAVAVSARTGAGIDELRSAIVDLVGGLEPPDATEDVRLWVDRRFHVRGAGTVVTGTLQAGTLRVGDMLAHGAGTVRVRGLQSLGQPHAQVSGVARVALSLGGTTPADLGRGSVLVTPAAWPATEAIDIRVSTGDTARIPERPLLHVGAAAVSVHSRPLDGDLVRLVLERALPLRIGDRALLRDPGSRMVWGLTVLDPEPPKLRRRGAAHGRAKELADHDGRPDLASELRRRGMVEVSVLRRIGVDTDVLGDDVPAADGWLLDPDLATRLGRRLQQLVAEHDHSSPLDRGISLAAAARGLDLPTPQLLATIVAAPLTLSGGKVRDGAVDGLPVGLLAAIDELERDLAEQPYAAPSAARLAALSLDRKALAAAAKAGRLLRVSDTIVLLPGADVAAAERLAGLPQPFTSGQARAALGTSRRVALPLLEHLDRLGLTRRLADDRRTTMSPSTNASTP